MELSVSAGMTPAEVVADADPERGDIAGMGNSGTVEAGKRAELAMFPPIPPAIYGTRAGSRS